MSMLLGIISILPVLWSALTQLPTSIIDVWKTLTPLLAASQRQMPCQHSNGKRGESREETAESILPQVGGLASVVALPLFLLSTFYCSPL